MSNITSRSALAVKTGWNKEALEKKEMDARCAAAVAERRRVQRLLPAGPRESPGAARGRQGPRCEKLPLRSCEKR